MLFRETVLVRLLGLKIPALAWCSPVVERLDDEACDVRIPLGWRTKNHLGSMYVGVLCAGADLASGLHAFRLIRTRYPDVKLVFADLRADFLKRADGDVVFHGGQGLEVAAAMEKAVATGERVTIPVQITATVPSKYGEEPVARFTLGLSLKNKVAAAEATRAAPASVPR
jgi:acyl-coenzyme A thioesterase PaaI-like protein